MRTKNKECTLDEINFVEAHINEMSNKELAEALGATMNHIAGIIAYYQLRRNEAGKRRARNQAADTWLRLRQDDLERVKQGLPPQTRIPISKELLAKYKV